MAPRIALSACAVLAVVCAHAQEIKPAAESDAAAQPAAKPGFIDAFGRWVQQGATQLKSGMQDAQQRIEQFGKQAHEGAKDLTGAVVGLPNARIVTAQERCVAAPNGAPDCQAAATSLCRSKGFQAGKIVDTKTEQKCSGRFLLEGRSPNSFDCASEIFVTRAVCQ
jgi:hypothetical protein